MFIGSELFTLDDRNRVVIPSKMVKEIPAAASRSLVVTRGPDKSIWAYPKNVWEETIRQQLESMDTSKKENLETIRIIMENAVELNLDGSNKITLPTHLLSKVGIKKQIKIIGMINHIEFWDPEECEKDIPEKETYFAEVSRVVLKV